MAPDDFSWLPPGADETLYWMMDRLGVPGLIIWLVALVIILWGWWKLIKAVSQGALHLAVETRGRWMSRTTGFTRETVAVFGFGVLFVATSFCIGQAVGVASGSAVSVRPNEGGQVALWGSIIIAVLTGLDMVLGTRIAAIPAAIGIAPVGVVVILTTGLAVLMLLFAAAVALFGLVFGGTEGFTEDSAREFFGGPELRLFAAEAVVGVLWIVSAYFFLATAFEEHGTRGTAGKSSAR